MSKPDAIMLCPEVNEAIYDRLRDFILADPSRSIDSVVQDALLLLLPKPAEATNA